jgi:hypothetical protein
MDGGRGLKLEVEKPIQKPSIPLPVIFSSGMHAEMPTRRRWTRKAHFFRRRTTESGTPVYSFYISDDAAH